MTRKRVIVSALTFALTSALVIAVQVQAAEQSLGAIVQSMDNAGITGAIRLTEIGAGKLSIETRVTGAGAGPQPIHIHDGTCDDMNPEPKIPLTDVVGGASSTEIDQTLQNLLATPHVIYLHRSPEELPVFVACANITAGGQVAALPSAGEADAWVELSPWMAGLGLGLTAVGYVLRRRAHRPASAGAQH
jgi:hypothetical protein